MERNKMLESAVRRAGVEISRQDTKRRLVCAVLCQGCGRRIVSDEDLSEVEWIHTKRGTDVFFCRACMRNVWNRKII
jgi:hypothetical protein